MSKFKPLLASPVEFDKIDYTDLWMSPKLDGIRAVVINGVVMSRSLKPIPNPYVQKLFGHLEHYDGELICGSPTSPSVYRDTNSACMSRDGEPDVTFYAFDHVAEPDADYITRYEQLEGSANVKVLNHDLVTDLADLEAIEQDYLDEGFEGAMLRKARGPNSKYKFGRATAKSNTLLKLKRMASDEAEIIDVIELEHNLNEATIDERGYTKRSTHQENKVGGGVMGAIVVRDIKDGCVFSIGTGFTAEDRKVFWDQRDAMVGRLVTYDHFPVGRKDLPRHPSFKGFRAPEDM